MPGQTYSVEASTASPTTATRSSESQEASEADLKKRLVSAMTTRAVRVDVVVLAGGWTAGTQIVAPWENCANGLPAPATPFDFETAAQKHPPRSCIPAGPCQARVAGARYRTPSIRLLTSTAS